MQPRLLSLLVAMPLAALAVPAGALAHAGHDHGSATPPPPASATRGLVEAAERAESAGYVRRQADGDLALKGRLELVHDHSVKAPGILYFLHTGGKRPHRLAIGKNAKIKGVSGVAGLESNQLVTVLASEGAGSTASVQQLSVTSSLQTAGLEPVTDLRPPQTRRMVVLRGRFADDPAGAVFLSEAAARTAAVDGPKSADKYLRETSNGNISLSVDVPPYLDIEMRRDGGCPIGPFVQQAIETAAEEANIDLAAYEHVAYVWEAPNCAQASGGISARTTSYPSAAQFEAATIGHEVGHNLGLSHSNRLLCRTAGAITPLSQDCENREYGDETTIMGPHWFMGLLSAFHRVQLGFMPLANMQPIAPSATATYTVYSGETARAKGTTQLLQLPRPNGEPERPFLYLDYRRPGTLFDTFPANAPLVNGVVVRTGPAPQNHLVGSQNIYANAGGSGGTNLRHTSREISTPLAVGNDTALRLNQSLWDPKADYSITVTEVTPERASVKVTPGGPPGDTTNVAVVNGGLIVFAGDGKPNNVILFERGGYVYVVDSSATVDAQGGCEPVDSVTARCPAPAIQSARVFLNDGDDHAAVSPDAPVGVPVTLSGGAGNDVLEGGPGDDILDGGPGGDILSGGGGENTLDYSSRTAAVKVGVDTNSDGEANEHDLRLSRFSTIRTGAGADTIKVPTGGPTTIEPGGGRDAVTGSGFADTIDLRDGAADALPVCGAGVDKVIRDALDPAPGSDCDTVVATAEAKIVTAPAAGSSTSTTQPRFTFSAPFASGVTFQCKLESGSTAGGAAFTACGSPWTAPTQTAGVKTFSVRAVQGGAPVGAAATRSFTIDTAPPVTTITAGPRRPQSGFSSAKFSFTSSEAGGWAQCRLDAGAWQLCESGVEFNGLAAGSHRFEVQSIDKARNVETTPVGWEWSYVPVQTSIVGGPAAGSTTEEVEPEFRLEAVPAAGATFTCAWDGAEAEPCTSPYTRAQLLAPGQHTLSVIAIDADGAADPTPATRTFTVRAPTFDTEITSGPVGGVIPTNDPTPTFGFRATGAGSFTFECKTLRQDWTACTSPFTFPTIKDRAIESFAVRAIRSDGLIDRTPDDRTFVVDIGAPVTTITGGPAPNAILTATTPQAFTFTTTDLVLDRTECSWDSGAWTKCTSPFTTPTLTGGNHRFAVRGIDKAGNVEADVVRNFSVRLPMVLTSSNSASAASSSLTTPSSVGPAVDWVHWKGPALTDRDRPTLSLQRLGTLSAVGTGTTSTVSGPTSVAWTNAATSPTAGTSNVGLLRTGAASGFKFGLAAFAKETRVLRLYVGVRGVGTTGTLKLTLGGTTKTLAFTATAAGMTNRTLSIWVRPVEHFDTLNVEWTRTGGTAADAAVALYAASVQ